VINRRKNHAVDSDEGSDATTRGSTSASSLHELLKVAKCDDGARPTIYQFIDAPRPVHSWPSGSLHAGRPGRRLVASTMEPSLAAQSKLWLSRP
jgi:hypothetical protein